MSPPSHQLPVWYGLHARLHHLPRARHDNQGEQPVAASLRDANKMIPGLVCVLNSRSLSAGVHAVCDCCGRGVAGRARPHVL